MCNVDFVVFCHTSFLKANVDGCCCRRAGSLEMIAPVDRTSEFCAAIKLSSLSTAKPQPWSSGTTTTQESPVVTAAVPLVTGPITVADAFTIESCELSQKIDAMKAELESQSRRYSDFSGRGFSDSARDELDASTTAFLRACIAQIEVLKSDAVARISRSRGGSCFAAHQLGTVAILNERLRGVSAVAERLRAARIREAVSARSNASAAGLAYGYVTGIERIAAEDRLVRPRGPEERADSEAEAAEFALHAQEFAQENAVLLTELVERREQMREAERTVAEIAGLNQLFATKVLEQAREIETLYDLAVEATTFVSRGNRELRQMKGKGPVVKYWIAFGILVLAFAILFLDWMSTRRSLIWII
jgi:syntaxin 18